MKVVIIDNDTVYLNRIVSVFNDKYQNEVELYTFSDNDIAQKSLSGKSIDILIIGQNKLNDVILEDLRFNPSLIVYFSETKDISLIHDHKVFCKYQKAELIYRDILNSYTEIEGIELSQSSDISDKNIFSFMSAAGGTGVSTVAIGFSYRIAKMGKSVLYLNLEKYNSVNVFLSGEGEQNMSDAFYAIISKKNNLSMKINNCIKTDKSGVKFFDKCKCVLDVSEMSEDDMETLVQSVTSLDFEYIVFDMPLEFNTSSVDVYLKSKKIFCITDGTEIANAKTEDAFIGFVNLDSKKKTHITDRVFVIYNKYLDNQCSIISNEKLVMAGGIPVFANNRKPCDVSHCIENMAMWNTILS